MKKNRRYRLFCFLCLLLVLSFHPMKPAPQKTDGQWTGTFRFLQKTTGPTIKLHEWTMQASFFRDIEGTAFQKVESETDEGTCYCHGEGESILELTIDNDTKTYSILAHIPECNGQCITKDGTVTETGQPPTAIHVEDQPLGKSPNMLSGSLVQKEGPYEDGTLITTTFTWSFSR